MRGSHELNHRPVGSLQEPDTEMAVMHARDADRDAFAFTQGPYLTFRRASSAT
ncbi:hypothetical protein [Rhodobacteraceae bacterium PD-2]|uniref:hypothetical protein n=1 Tax=Ponticoccus alexandrii TaxID=1943633 RepID=UPI0003D1ABFF